MRTKGRKFLPLLLLSLILTAACMPTVALAKSNEDVTAEITAEVSKDKTSAEVTVHLQNTGNEPVSKVRIQGVLPEGLSLEEGDTLTKEEETLAPGSETALQYTVKAAKHRTTADPKTVGIGKNPTRMAETRTHPQIQTRMTMAETHPREETRQLPLLPRMQMPLTPGTPQIRSFSLSYA